MTPCQGYELAKHHRVGTVIVMGPVSACVRRINPVSEMVQYAMLKKTREILREKEQSQ